MLFWSAVFGGMVGVGIGMTAYCLIKAACKCLQAAFCIYYKLGLLHVNLVKYTAIGEELLLCRFPAAEIFVYGHQLQLWEFVFEFLCDFGIDGAVEVFGDDALCVFGVEAF